MSRRSDLSLAGGQLLVPKGTLLWVPHHTMHNVSFNWDDPTTFLPGACSRGTPTAAELNSVHVQPFRALQHMQCLSGPVSLSLVLASILPTAQAPPDGISLAVQSAGCSLAQSTQSPAS